MLLLPRRPRSTRPPPLGTLPPGGGPPDIPDLRAATTLRRRGRWRQRRDNTRYLVATSTSLKEQRDALVSQIKAAMKQNAGKYVVIVTGKGVPEKYQLTTTSGLVIEVSP